MDYFFIFFYSFFPFCINLIFFLFYELCLLFYTRKKRPTIFKTKPNGFSILFSECKTLWFVSFEFWTKFFFVFRLLLFMSCIFASAFFKNAFIANVSCMRLCYAL